MKGGRGRGGEGGRGRGRGEEGEEKMVCGYNFTKEKNDVRYWLGKERDTELHDLKRSCT